MVNRPITAEENAVIFLLRSKLQEWGLPADDLPVENWLQCLEGKSYWVNLFGFQGYQVWATELTLQLWRGDLESRDWGTIDEPVLAASCSIHRHTGRGNPPVTADEWSKLDRMPQIYQDEHYRRLEMAARKVLS